MPKKSIKINSVLVCENIRKEDNGKLFFIGVYPGNIVSFQSPANLVFSFWFDCFTKQRMNKIEIKIVLTKKSDNSSLEHFKEVQEHSTDTNIPIDNGIHFNIGIVGLQIRAEEDSILIVSVRPIGGKWKELSRRNIIFSVGSSRIVQPS